MSLSDISNCTNLKSDKNRSTCSVAISKHEHVSATVAQSVSLFAVCPCLYGRDVLMSPLRFLFDFFDFLPFPPFYHFHVEINITNFKLGELWKSKKEVDMRYKCL